MVKTGDDLSGRSERDAIRGELMPGKRCRAKLEGGRRICDAPPESSIHMVDSKNAEIRMGAHAFVEPSNASFAVGGDSMGWRTVHVVDEHGCELHSEPVCLYHVAQHPWFEKWIMEQEVPAEYPALLWHPVLGVFCDFCGSKMTPIGLGHHECQNPACR